MTTKEAIAELVKKPCTCVFCDDCGGTGSWARGFPDDPCYVDEPCGSCSGGIVEVCERCREIEELEEDAL